MPSRNHAENWVKFLRDSLRRRVGSWVRIYEQVGKVKVDMRFKNGERALATLPIDWEEHNALQIENIVLKLAEQVGKGKTLRQAVESFYGVNKDAPEAVLAPSYEQLENTWNEFGENKLELQQIKEKTWKRDYKKSWTKLEQVIEEKDFTNAKDLLKAVSKTMESGSRSRKQTIQHLAQWLRFAVENNYLDKKLWEPPRKESKEIRDLVGESLTQKQLTVPIYDTEIEELLESISKNRETRAANRWIFALQLLSVYGCRPTELNHLRVVNYGGRKAVYCDYQKRGGGGKTEKRELFGLHQKWEKDWNLIEKLEQGYELPPFGSNDVAEAARKFLIRQPYWKKLREQKDIKVYSFRHGYCWRLHTHPDYMSKIDTRTAAQLLGHSHETHLRVYGAWTPQGSIRERLENILTQSIL